jgi:hypothetical protein
MGMGGAVRLDGLQEAAATVDAAELDDARFGFDRAHPHRSARRVVYFTQAFALAAVVGGLAWALIAAPAIAFTAFASLRSRAVRLRYSLAPHRCIKPDALTLAPGRSCALPDLHDPLPALSRGQRRVRPRRCALADRLARHGGASNHFRTEALRYAGGWDPFNVTEDAYLTLAAFRAIWELTFRPHHRSKTQHGVSQRPRASRWR